MTSLRGTALIEFTLIVPVILFLLLNAINFGFYIYAWITVSNAARAAAQYQSYNGVAVTFPGTPNYSQVLSSLYTTDISSLPTPAPTLTICRRNTDGTTILWGGTGSCAWVPSDPEPTDFMMWGVSVSYNFQQLVGANAIGVYGLPTTIQQQIVMRSLQ